MLRERERRRNDSVFQRKSRKKLLQTIISLRTRLLNQETEFTLRMVEKEKKFEKCLSELLGEIPDDDFEPEPITPEKPKQPNHKSTVLETKTTPSESFDDDDFEKDVPQEHIVDCSGDVVPVTRKKSKKRKSTVLQTNTTQVRRSKRNK